MNRYNPAAVSRFPTGLVVLGLGLVAFQAEARDRIREVRSWTYQLQKVDMNALAGANVDLVVIDAMDDDLRPWSIETIKALRKGPNGKPRIVLAYLSVGEAESYRPYWQKEWNRRRPDWIGRMNPYWRDNYPVKYWAAEWNTILLSQDGVIDKILAQGFDGIYLDRLDVYTRWGPHGKGSRNEVRNASAMVDLVDRIANHIRTQRKRNDFLIVAQNAPALAQHPAYLQDVDAIALEDLLYYRNKRRAKRYTREILDLLKPARRAGLPLLAVDYLTRSRARRRYPNEARAHGLVPYAAPSVWLDRVD